MGFPYVQEHGRFLRFLPVISLQLKDRGTKDWITFDAFVDSGASYSIFKTEIGDILSEKMFITVGFKICFDEKDEKEKIVEFYSPEEQSRREKKK